MGEDDYSGGGARLRIRDQEQIEIVGISTILREKQHFWEKSLNRGKYPLRRGKYPSFFEKTIDLETVVPRPVLRWLAHSF